jgi:hypothetical protein
MARRGRDQAGNIWELDDQGNAVRLIQAAQAPSAATPGALGVVPPNPAIVAQKQREQQRQDAADRRAEEANQRAAQAEARAQQKFQSEDTMAPPPGDTAKTGEDYLKTIPPSLAGQVRALAEGRRAFPTGTALRSPAVQQLIAAATQYDPTLDAANAATRVATRKDFTSGKSAQNITALNTVIGHLGSLWKSAQALHNRGLVPWNALANAAESTAGDPRLNNYLLARKAVADELERVFRQTGGNVSEIQEWKGALSSSSSPERFRGAMAKAMELLNSRLDALGAQYNQGMGRSDQPISLLKPHAQAVFQALQEGGSGVLPDAGGNGPAAPPPVGPTGGGKGPPGGIPRADYLGMVGGNQSSLATGATRNVFDPVAAQVVSAFIRKGTPFETVAAYLQSHGIDANNPEFPKQYAAALAFQQQHPDATPNVEALKTLPTTLGERLSSSPEAAALVAVGTAATAGLSDVAARNLVGPQWDANRQALAATNPNADIAGNVAGGLALGGFGAPALRAVSPAAAGALATVGTRLGRFAAPAGDLAYGATYGGSENPGDPLGGAAMGGLTGLIAGQAGRSATRGLANVIAPPAGEFGPAYAQGVFPTLGQRVGRAGALGRAVNTAEQAMQSFPGLGALVSRARQVPRNQFQIGAFNDALGDIGQRLPDNMAPGTEPHAFSAQAFRDAYNTARQGMQFIPDGQYVADHAAFNQRLNSGVLNQNQVDQVQRVINNSVGSRLPNGGGAMNGQAYQTAGTEIGDAINTWSRDGTTRPMADALRDYQTIFDDAARRNSNPQAVQLLDSADRGYAKLVRIQDAAQRVGGDSGTFSPRAFDRSVQRTAGGVRSGPYLRGEALMQDYADAGRGLVDTLPNSGSAERLLTGQAVAGTGGFALGAPTAIAAHPGSLAPFAAYLPGVDALLKRAIAPRDVTLPPPIADPLNAAAGQINLIAPYAGRAAIPGALAYFGVPQ